METHIYISEDYDCFGEKTSQDLGGSCESADYQSISDHDMFLLEN